MLPTFLCIMVSHFRSRAKLLGIYFHATGSSGFFAVAALMQEARGCINASAWKRDIKRVSHLNLYAGLSVESIAMSIVERNLLLLPAALTNNIDALFCAASGAGESESRTIWFIAGFIDTFITIMCTRLMCERIYRFCDYEISSSCAESEKRAAL